MLKRFISDILYFMNLKKKHRLKLLCKKIIKFYHRGPSVHTVKRLAQFRLDNFYLSMKRATRSIS